MSISTDPITGINGTCDVRSAICADDNQGCALSSERTSDAEKTTVAYNAGGSSAVTGPDRITTCTDNNQGCQLSRAAIADLYCKDGGGHRFLVHGDVATSLKLARLLVSLSLLVWGQFSFAEDYYWQLINNSIVYKASTPAKVCQAYVSSIGMTHPVAEIWGSGYAAKCNYQTRTDYWVYVEIFRQGNTCSLPKVYNEQTGECKAPENINVGQICQERSNHSDSDPLLVQIDGSCKKLSHSPMNKGTPHANSCTGTNSLAGNPINFATGNKLQIETDLGQIKHSDLEITRQFNSIDGLWRHNYSKELRTGDTVLVLTDNDGAESYFRITGELATPINGYGRILKKENDAWTLYNSDNSSDTFNSTGRVSAHRSADLSYDITYSNGLIEVIDKSGFKITITEDTQKQPLKITTPNATFTYSYNDISRLVSVIKTANGIHSKRTYSYGVKSAPNLLTDITDERGIRYATWTYDDQGRAISSEHAGGAERTLVSYNADGSSTVTNALGKRTTYRFQTIQGIRRITAIEGEPSANCPNSNSTFTYDDRGLVKTRTDNKGNITTFDYNDRGLEVSRTEAFGTPQARTITTTWHPTLFLPATVTEPDRITTYSYDDQGRPLSQSVSQR
ncbi:hypothetical protein PHLH8_11380 [Pseudomonas sp. Pc102]|uniref:DUF6531 domain-containing protein n=1 Tax=Pseudomonas sp. Pc102 TaxID=2678261 RepID=UPI001BD0572D|nr:DUF6531 domain-containing protein [Pseudomonas sp. Pc102]BBP81496.1 hypothetical protein PHLH8_11380 [Pseudomonas sp. Pc102]